MEPTPVPAGSQAVPSAKVNSIVIVSGLSGAGKSRALHHLEDMGYFCIDNLLPALIPEFIRLISREFKNIAVVVDARGGSFLGELSGCLHDLKELGHSYTLLYLTASEQVLVQRFSETRRRHPIATGSVLESIREEQRLLEDVRGQAHAIIDTSNLRPEQLRERLANTINIEPLAPSGMVITVVSFGYKFGVPMDADLVFDVRFLRNPHYVPEFRGLTGLDEPVQTYIIDQPLAREYLERLLAFTGFLVPHYREEGKSHLTIAVGCTGGRHRSVAIAQRLGSYLGDQGYRVWERHRDIHQDPQKSLPWPIEPKTALP